MTPSDFIGIFYDTNIDLELCMIIEHYANKTVIIIDAE